MARHKKRRQADAPDLEYSLRAELRAILRQYDDLKRPIDRFIPHPLREDGVPRYFVLFDRSDLHDITGLRCGMKSLVVPDELILDHVARFAESVWHLKDHLHRLAKARDIVFDAEAVVSSSEALKICADLANTKKHGACENRSGLNPQLGVFSSEAEADGPRARPLRPRQQRCLRGVLQRRDQTKGSVSHQSGPRCLSRGCSRRRRQVNQWRGIIREMRVREGDNPESVSLRQRLLADIEHLPEMHEGYSTSGGSVGGRLNPTLLPA